GAVAEALRAVGEVRALLEPAGPPPRPPSPPRALAPAGGAFWEQIAHPGGLGFLAELWPHLVDAAAALFPPPAERTPPREARIVAGAEPRLGWIETTAVASGISGLRLYLARAAAPAGQV